MSEVVLSLVRSGGGVVLKARNNENGANSNILLIRSDGTIHRSSSVNRGLGFNLDLVGKVRIRQHGD